MRIAKGLRSIVAAVAFAAVSVAGVAPVQSMTIPALVPVNTAFSGNSDQIFSGNSGAGYGLVLGETDTSFFIEFQVTSKGVVSFGAGSEGAALADVDVTDVSLINKTDNSAIAPASTPIVLSEGAGPNTPSPFTGDLHSDAFFASFAGLVPGTTYQLLVDVVVFDTSGSPFGGPVDYFTGQISFNVVPIPPALLLFASSLLGMGILSRRRRTARTA